MGFFCLNLRSQLWVIDEVLQWVAAAEFIQQTGQVADYGRWIGGVDVARDVPNLNQRHVPISVEPMGRADLHTETFQLVSITQQERVGSGVVYHQAGAAGLQGAEADAEQDRRGEGVVVDEASALRVAVLAVQGQVWGGVTGVQHRTEVDLQGDGLDPAVDADVPLSWTSHRDRITVYLQTKNWTESIKICD